MSKINFGKDNYIKQAPENNEFPFTFELELVEDTDKQVDSVIKYTAQMELLPILKDDLISKIDFNSQFNKYSESYNSKDLKFVYEFQLVEDTKILLVNYVRVYDIKTKYSFTLVESIEQLKEIINKAIESNKISFDIESTGLNPERDSLVGYSFAYNTSEAYYVAVNHIDKYNKYNLGKEALDLIYDALVKVERVYMFNSRFDMRFMEYTDSRYDMVKIANSLVDVQVNCYLADSDFRYHGLKSLEKYYLGIYRSDFEETLSKGSQLNWAYMNPREALFYAATDALTTFMLGEETMKYLDEAKLSGQLDQKLLVPLMKMENRGIRVDHVYLTEEKEKLDEELFKLKEYLAKHLGDINLNSPKQRQDLFKSFGLDTGERTKTGAMSTGRNQIISMVDKMEEEGEEIPEWLLHLGNYSRLEKLSNTFFDNLYNETIDYDNETGAYNIIKDRVRFNYRNTQTATGRLSSGKEIEY